MAVLAPCTNRTLTAQPDISQQNVKQISLLVICFSSSNTYPHLFIGLFGFGRSRLVDIILRAQSFRRVRRCPSFDSGPPKPLRHKVKIEHALA